MQFRHNQGVRLALLSGHITHVGPEWKELDQRFEQAAFAANCECNKNEIPARKEVVAEASPEGMTNTNDSEVIRRALVKMIERDSEADDFTNAGLPNLKVLRREAGIEIDKGLAYEIFNELKAEAAKE